jgi:hypothetical protein
VISQYDRYKAAMFTFLDKYRAIPGDISNADNFWPLADPTPAVCQVTASTGPETCNGNGNGKVELTYERFRFWQQLANGDQLIEGNYSGVVGPGGGTDGVPGTNIPALKLSDGGVAVNYSGTLSGDVNFYDGFYGHVLFMGARRAGSAPINPLFRPQEAWNIDVKIDDGKPGQGSVRSHKPAWLPNCADTAVETTAQYVVTYTDRACVVIMMLGY